MTLVDSNRLCLVSPITTYGSEIWISDFSQKDLKRDNIPFEKIHNRFCKYLLGVHKKASNFVSRCELGRLPIISFITSLAFKYYSRLKQLPPTRLLHEVFEVDTGLFKEGHKSWFSFIDSSAKKYKINIPNFSINEIPKMIADFYKKLVEDQFEIFSNIDVDSKLNTFAKCYKEFNLQKYLDFNLPKSLVKILANLRISAHTLLIEKGRYHRPKLPRDLKTVHSIHVHK